jgi:hypothetical protein
MAFIGVARQIARFLEYTSDAQSTWSRIHNAGIVRGQQALEPARRCVQLPGTDEVRLNVSRFANGSKPHCIRRIPQIAERLLRPADSTDRCNTMNVPVCDLPSPLRASQVSAEPKDLPRRPSELIRQTQWRLRGTGRSVRCKRSSPYRAVSPCVPDGPKTRLR